MEGIGGDREKWVLRLGADSEVLFLAVGLESGDGQIMVEKVVPHHSSQDPAWDFERQLTGGISWHSCIPGQLFIEQKGFKKTTSLVSEGLNSSALRLQSAPL